MVKWIFLQFCLAVLIMPLQGQTDSLRTSAKNDAPSGSFGLFEDDGIMDVTIRFDLTTYLRKKPKDDFLKAELTFHSGETDSITRNVRLKTRGEFRNMYCGYAPIELNFKKVDFGFSDLDSIDKLKLVTQCSNGTDDENYILKEYLVYKLFSVLTDTSFRVRLLRVTYIDSKRERKPITQYAFFMEPVELLAARVNTVQIKTAALTQKHIVPYVMDRLAIFNYMIGNYDWSIPGQHNVKVFSTADPARTQYGIAIPYDFDWSGFVNTTYAIPAENVGTTTVRQRLFLGVCRSKETFNKDLDPFAANEQNFYRIINEFPHLKQREKADVIDFLDEFFDQVRGNRNSIVSYLVNSCKNF